MSEEVHVVAVLSPKPGKESAVVDALKDLAGKVQEHEQGALRYDVFEQTNGDGPADIVVVERYSDVAAYEYHKTTDWYITLGKRAMEEGILAKGLDIRILKPVSLYER